ncbi:MAG: hypothetical protein U9Q82_15055 [Chloroflexota bacterium]|nr:hypothetical protein [Chloroflexota bacterium]
MEKITVQVTDSSKGAILFELLQSLDFVELVSIDEKQTETATDNQAADFFSLAGLWEGRDIQLDTIRQKAWPRQST